MAFNANFNQNKARIITVVFHALLVIWFAFAGLKYQDPPPEDGIAVNFGYEDDGFGEEAGSSSSNVESVTPPTPQTSTPSSEEVVTQDAIDAPSIDEVEEEVSEQPQQENTEPKEVEPEKDPEPTAEEIAEAERKAKEDAQKNNLNSIFNNQNTTGGGEGTTKGSGDQGDPNGDPLTDRRDGTGGSGDKGYFLGGGRSPKNIQEPNNDCNKEGVVIVKIRVNRDGRVVEVEGGVNIESKGLRSNFSDTCLKTLAEEAAKKTTWTPKPDAPNLQVGYIVYNFKLK